MSESLVLTNLLDNDEYARKVLPFLRLSYFKEPACKTIFETYVKYFEKYNAPPTREVLAHEVNNITTLSDNEFEDTLDNLEALVQDSAPKFDWLVDTTEAFCQDRALENAISECISIQDGESKVHTKNAIPDILKEALAVSFDTHIGHDYFEDYENRFEFYNTDHPRIPFDLEMFNKITNGGIPRKTLNVILAGTNVGKTLAMVHMAAQYMMQGKNVLYVTFEMSEEAISNRIDANLFEQTVNEVENMDKINFYKGIQSLHSKTHGKLIVKEYPTSGAHVGHMRQLLQELRLKKGFVPDVVMVDYIGIMASARVKLANTNSYFYIKAIAEELRGLAVEFDVPVWSAVQVNRQGYGDSDFDLTNTAESFGLPATADFMIAAIRTEELDALGQILWKQLKSRYGNKNFYEKFVTGVDPDRMRLYDVDPSAQDGIMQSDGNVSGPPEANKKRDTSGLKI